MIQEGNIVIYTNKENESSVSVTLKNNSIWLSQKQMAELFDKNSDTIGLHLKNIYTSGELEEFSTTEDFSVVQRR